MTEAIDLLKEEHQLVKRVCRCLGKSVGRWLRRVL